MLESEDGDRVMDAPTEGPAAPRPAETPAGGPELVLHYCREPAALRGPDDAHAAWKNLLTILLILSTPAALWLLVLLRGGWRM